MAMLVVLAFLALVAFAAKRRFFPQSQLWFLKHHSKKQEKEHGETSAQQVEIVVDKPQNSSKLAAFDKGRKPLLVANPPRYEEPAKEGSVEGSIRTALNELRSRQYVKSICSKFEARKAIRHSDDDEEEEARIRVANADGDEYVLSEQSQQLRRDEHIVKVAPLPRRTSAPKPNNLNAFLRRCSSNLDRANFAHSPSSDASNTLEQLEPLVPAAAATVAVAAVPNVATRAATVDPPAASGRRSGLFDIGESAHILTTYLLPVWMHIALTSLTLSLLHATRPRSPASR
jgi:hypothetical protein